jgi:hypothetical protein
MPGEFARGRGIAMRARRILVWGVSVALGVVGVVAVIAAFKTTLSDFSWSNITLVFLACGSLAFIWLDYFLKTQYLRS